MSVSDRTARREPRYRRIARQLLDEIATGRHPVGSLIPTEVELCRRFRASRYTVREALRVITAKGLVSRRPGAGSVVVATSQPAVFTQSVSSLAELLSYPQDTFRERRDAGEVIADRALARALGCKPGARWFRIRALRRSPGIALPLAWTDFYLLPDYAAVIGTRQHAREPVYTQIERMFGVTTERARVEMYPSRVPAELASALEVAAGSPALTIIRSYLDRDGRTFEVTVSVHPENRFHYSLELRRELRAPH